MEGAREPLKTLFHSYFLTLVFVMFEKFPCGKKSWQTLVINLHTNTRLLIRLLRQSLFLSDSPYYTLVVGAQPAVSRFLFRQAVFCAATVRSIISLYKLVAAVNSRIFIATLSFAAKAFSILNKGPNHLKSKCEILILFSFF